MLSETLAQPKRKARRTFTLDNDLVEYLDSSGNASATANSMLRAQVAFEERQAALAALVAELEQKAGPANPTLLAEARAAFAQ